MKVSLSIEVPDHIRAGIRAHFNRGGKATRNEVRVWINQAIAAAGRALPAPKVRAKRVAGGTLIGPFVPSHVRRAQIEALPDEAVCARCGKTKERHGRMGFTCPPASGLANGGTFQEATR